MAIPTFDQHAEIVTFILRRFSLKAPLLEEHRVETHSFYSFHRFFVMDFDPNISCSSGSDSYSQRRIATGSRLLPGIS